MSRADAGPAAGTAGKIEFRILQEAAEWFAVLSSQEAGDDALGRWRSWLAADAGHREAWAQVEAISGKFERLPAGDKPAAHRVLDAASGRQAARRRAFGMLALLCGAGIGAGALTRATPWRAWMSAYRTGTGQSREIHLADETRIWLNTASAIDVDYDATLRQVILRAGEILVQTAPDTAAPPRPFVVDTLQGRLRALGTRFSVRQLDDAGIVAVFEGAVEILPRESNGPDRIVRAGEQARFTADRSRPAVPAEARRQSWMQGLLVTEDMRLEDFLSDLSRYRHGYLGCDPRVADVRIVGAYALADTDRVLSALEATLPVRVRSPLPWWTVVEPR